MVKLYGLIFDVQSGGTCVLCLLSHCLFAKTRYSSVLDIKIEASWLCPLPNFIGKDVGEALPGPLCTGR